MNKPSNTVLFATAWLAGFVIAARGQTTSHWNNATGGDWHQASNWDPADVPDTPLEIALIRTPGTYTIRIDRNQYPGGLANERVLIATNAADAASVTAAVVAVNSGAGTELIWEIGTNNLNYAALGLGPAINIGRNNALALTNVNLVLRGRWGNNYAPAAVDIAAGAFFNMANGRLDIFDNSIHGGFRNNGLLILEGVDMALERMSAGGVFHINGCTGYVTQESTVSGSPGIIGDSTIAFNASFAGRGTLFITNSLLTIRSNYDVGPRANVYYDASGVNYIEEGSVVTIGTRLWIAGQITTSKTSPPCEFWVHGGSVTNKGATRLGGWSEGSSVHSRTGNGMFGMTAGIFESTDLHIGCLVTGDVSTGRPDPDGYYFQTGGASKFSGLITLYSNTNGLDGCGAMQFVMGSNAVMTLTGEGMAADGNGPWLMDFNSETNFDTRGTFVFAPDGVETQTLLAFAEESGGDTAMTTNNTAVGTLDLRELAAGGKKLDVVPAGNFGTNAVYVNSLLMGGTPAPGAHFTASANSQESPLYVYYNAGKSDIRGGTHAFSDGNGALIPINVPRGTIIVFPGR